MKVCDQRDLRENEQFGNNKKIVIIIIYIDGIVFAVTVVIINFVMTFQNCLVLKATLMWKNDLFLSSVPGHTTWSVTYTMKAMIQEKW